MAGRQALALLVEVRILLSQNALHHRSVGAFPYLDIRLTFVFQLPRAPWHSL